MVEEMKVNVYLRHKKNSKEIKCMCKRSDPGCDRFKSCIKEKVYFNEYKGLKEAIINSEKRR